MRGRALLLLGLLVLPAAAAWLAWSAGAPPPGITRSNFRRIQVGMTQGEVEALLGGPPQTLALWGPDAPNPERGKDYEYCGLWSGLEVDVIVYFDHGRRMVRSECHGSSEDSLLDHLRRCLGS